MQTLRFIIVFSVTIFCFSVPNLAWAASASGNKVRGLLPGYVTPMEALYVNADLTDDDDLAVAILKRRDTIAEELMRQLE